MVETVYTTGSTYRSDVKVTDQNNELFSFDGGEDVIYSISRRKGLEESIYSVTDTDEEMTIEPDNETGRVIVDIEPSDVTWSGVVWEEYRIQFFDGTEGVVLQRPVAFDSSSTAFK